MRECGGERVVVSFRYRCTASGNDFGEGGHGGSDYRKAHRHRFPDFERRPVEPEVREWRVVPGREWRDGDIAEREVVWHRGVRHRAGEADVGGISPTVRITRSRFARSGPSPIRSR